MSTTYFFYIEDNTGIAAKVTLLDSKLSIDLEISTNYSTSVYNAGTDNLEVTFSAALSEQHLEILTNIVDIIIYDQIVGSGVYIVTEDGANNRCSANTSSAPTINHDVNLGYNLGSQVITSAGIIYECTDNTIDTAIWTIISLVEASYVTLSNHPDLTQERSLISSSNINFVDGGPDSTLSLDLTDTGVSSGLYTYPKLQVDLKGRITFIDAVASSVMVQTLADFPAPVGGVITLVPATVYYITGIVDITPNVLSLGADSLLQGRTAFNDGIVTANATTALIQSVAGFNAQNVFLSNPLGSIFNITGNLTKIVLLEDVVFANSVSCGLIENVAISAMNTVQMSADCLNGLTYGKTIAEILHTRFAIFSTDPAFTMCTFNSDLVSEFISITNHSINNLTGQVGIDVISGATIGRLFISTCNFKSNGGTPLQGAAKTEPYVLSRINVGLTDSRIIGGMGFVGNTESTIITGIGVYVPMGSGTTSPPHLPIVLDTSSERFELTGTFPNQKIKYIGLDDYQVVVYFNLYMERGSGSGGKLISVRGTVNGAPVSGSTIEREINNVATGGSNEFTITLNTNDEIGVEFANLTDTSNIRVKSFRMTIK